MTKEEAAAILNATRGKTGVNEWPFIFVHCQTMGSFAYFSADEERRAVEHRQPADTFAAVKGAPWDWAERGRPSHRLADCDPSYRARLIRLAVQRFPNSEVAQAAAVLYSDEL